MGGLSSYSGQVTGLSGLASGNGVALGLELGSDALVVPPALGGALVMVGSEARPHAARSAATLGTEAAAPSPRRKSSRRVSPPGRVLRSRGCIAPSPITPSIRGPNPEWLFNGCYAVTPNRAKPYPGRTAAR
jgi:hypothetical protein